MKFLAAILITGIVQCGIAATAYAGIDTSPSSTAKPSPQSQALADAVAMSERGDVSRAIPALNAIIASKDFGQLSLLEQRTVYRILAVDETLAGDHAAAFAAAKHASEMDIADVHDWILRAGAAQRMGDTGDEVLSITTAAKRFPDYLPQIDDDYILAINRLAGSLGDGGRSQRQFLQALFDAQWRPRNPFLDTDVLLLDLVGFRQADGDVSGAQKIADRIAAPSELLAISVDRRFAQLTQYQTEPGAFTHIDEQYLERMKMLSQSNPQSLEGVVTVAQELIVLHRNSEALSLIDSALGKVKSPDDNPFSDYDERAIWAIQVRVDALSALGRNDEALAAQIDASRHPERGHPNVSQTLNLSEMYNDLGRPHDALAVLADFDPANVSLYGKMVLMSDRACSFAQLGNREQLSETLKFMTDHARDAPRLQLEALLCSNDLDGAARAFIAQLEDPATRTSALVATQYDSSPDSLPPFKREWVGRWRALLARPDVVAEISRVGRVGLLQAPASGK